MRLSIVTSKHAASFYVIKDVLVAGKWTTKRVEKLGTREQIQARIGDQDPVLWAKEYIKKLNAQEKEEKQEVIAHFSSSRQIPKGKPVLYQGGYLFLQALYHQLGLPRICRDIQKKHDASFDLSDILSMLVYTRILSPSSKASSLEQAKHFLQKPQAQLHQVYRALSILAQHQEQIQVELYKNSKELLTRNNRILYYDCTNYYFEIEEEDEFRRYGLSKEHRPNPLVQMGLFMDGHGLPLAFSLFNGNQNEQSSLKPLEERILQDFSLAQIVVCTDAGLASHDNRVLNDAFGRAFVVTQSLKKLKAYLRKWALDPTHWQLAGSDEIFDLSSLDVGASEQQDKLYYKQRWIKEKGLEQQIIVTFSPKYKLYQEAIREKQIERAIKKVQTPSSLKKKRPNDVTRFIQKISVTKEGEVAEKELYFLNTEEMSQEAQYDGFYAVCTNLEDKPLDIIQLNKGRWEIEAAFRCMKTDFRARPVYLSRKDRIEAHFLSCFIALLIYRVLRLKMLEILPEQEACGESILQTLRDMNFYDLQGEGFVPAYTRTALTDALHEHFAFRTDTQIVPKNVMKKIFSQTKKTNITGK